MTLPSPIDRDQTTLPVSGNGWKRIIYLPSQLGREWYILINQWREGMGFPRDFLRESCRNGMAGRRPAPKEGGGKGGLRPVIPSKQLSRGKSQEKPIPSRHWLIRITFYIALEWYKFYACSWGSTHRNSRHGLQEEGPCIKILCMLPRDKTLRAPTSSDSYYCKIHQK